MQFSCSANCYMCMIKHIFFGAQAFNWAIRKEFRNISSTSGHFALVTSINSVTSQSWTIILFSEGKMEGLGLYYYLRLKQSWFVFFPHFWLRVPLYRSHSVDLLIPQQGSYCDVLKFIVLESMRLFYSSYPNLDGTTY